ncbi:two component transcriptional regulator, LuxR family [Chthoniobacter flavus Ellin428]|uniref:Two component transcriptional regulator, LuxR family n=1 Tax=Chthoniobacter flavus Ellin428 TaxID=497964 RepID=B4DBM9_9BACT|nr:response regulator transcription factor [Chthoniobacter flavus]EDY16131.1 two component transcriptional regulator, LuxR family [Chthoniobacter flavus Ellin428]TCO86732.1 LuxR family two component transcriptional regulator [Chthoniobacter flavus]
MRSPTNTRILIVDDHFIARKGLIGSLSAEPDIEIVAEANNGFQAVEMFVLHRPDLVLMDVRLPLQDGVQAARTIRNDHPQARIAMLTVSDAEEDILGAIDAGVVGYLPKSVEREQLLTAIHRLAEGGEYFAPEIEAKLRSTNRVSLTKRETEVLTQIVKGRSNKEIGYDLGIAEPTVRLHLTHLFKKLHVMDRTQAAMVAVQRGLVRTE